MRADTPAAAADALAQVAAGYPQPPLPLQPHELPFWAVVLAARLPSQWALIDLTVAVNLCRCLGAIEANTGTLAREGDMIGKGDMRRVNPRRNLVEHLNKQAMAMTRMLQLHGVPTTRAADRAPQKSEAMAAAKTLSKIAAPAAHSFNSDDLLARPHLQ